MSRKKKQQASASGVYALCVTVGLIIGLGLTPLMGNLPIMVVVGAVAGVIAAFLITRKRPAQQHHHRRHH